MPCRAYRGRLSGRMALIGVLPIMWRKRIHFLVCQNERAPDARLACCARGLGRKLLERLLGQIRRHGSWMEIQATGTDCLGACRPEGTAVIVYPEGTWYVLPTEGDADLLFDAYQSGERPEALDRLRLSEPEEGQS